jgi:hypothetical protein
MMPIYSSGKLNRLRQEGKSQTDWERVKNLTDREIDFSDLPELEEEFFKLAKVTRRESQLYNRVKINRLAELPKMTAQLMVQPSYLMTSGIAMREFGNIYLFRFTDELQSRFEELLLKKKTNSLTVEEEAEYAGISDLERIFTLINAQLAAKSQWCPLQLEDGSENEPDITANTAIPPNT